MTDLTPWYEARRHMVDAVITDLYGGPSDEELAEEPLQRYIVGILHPRTTEGALDEVEVADEEPESEVGAAVDADFDPGVSFAHLRHPSTMGLTFGAVESTSILEVEVSADRYEAVDRDAQAREESDVATRASSTRTGRWERRSFGPVTESVALEPGSVKSVDLVEGLSLRIVQRKPIDGVVNVTMVLVNTHVRPEKGRADDKCWFRPSIKVSTTGGEFADRRQAHLVPYMDPDEQSGELLYRRSRNLAVGHGVAVTWEESEKVVEISTTFFPKHELNLAQAERDDVSGLGMNVLASAGVVSPLEDLIDRYEAWISDQSARVAELPDSHVPTARRHLEAATRSAARMRRGVALLGSDPVADRAFRVMNEVMQQQRVRQEMARRGLDSPPEDVAGEWRPFQIAFILQNLEGLTDPSSDDRDVADLLWFPTGGGKTEAYLGLIAFTLVLRRLREVGEGRDGAGVGVIMRYTLRLLTLQQFERAAGLICALEDWRRRTEDVSEWKPFSIGLWVGTGATPNSIKDAARALRKRRNNEDPGDSGDPVQLLRCPWCASQLGPENYHADTREDRLVVRCPDPLCAFGDVDGLPVHLVDSQVYGERPSLVIGTVDKFAMLAWQQQSGSLFGTGYDVPPDLIIQDELHLISGPLGTLVGLYETAIDALATDPRTGARPKLVASTATIRRATDQVRAVFARDAHQFPPPGIDADDSFFAVDASPSVKGTREYVGLMAPSASHATLLVRTYAAALQAAHDLDAPDEVRDAYWTMLGYFNSLRVLGAAYIQSIDDVRDRIKVVARRNGTDPRSTRDPRELTSRKKSSEIPHELDALQTAYGSEGCPDIVLATNMISVGVDVDRLGLMAVMGQPQTTSEYIQATSRVGRSRPGLVFTLFNASRSRDLSHYEGFTSYHRALYRQVEATSATPFAPRALDRGLHGLLVILARHRIDGASGDKAVSIPLDADELADQLEVVVNRASELDPASVPEVREALDGLIEQWRLGVERSTVDRYVRWAMQSSDIRSLMIPAGASTEDTGSEPLAEIFPPTEPPWPTLTSLRNVDRESTLKIVHGRRVSKRGNDGNE